MKIFSVYYVPVKEDIICYCKKMRKASLTEFIKKLFLPFAIMSAIGLFYNFFVFLGAVCFFIIAACLNAFATGEGIKKAAGRTRLYKPNIIDFYVDHIEFIRLDGEKGKKITELHFSFRDITYVLETDEYYFFVIPPLNIITVPKRVLKQEEFEMIGNLINNIFSDKYQRI